MTVVLHLKKKSGKGRAYFLQERSEELCCKTSAYKKFLLQNSSKDELQNLGGAHLITAPVIHQMKEFVGNEYNKDADLKFLKSGPSVEYHDVNDAIRYESSSKDGDSKGSSMSSSSSTSDFKEYEDLCKSLKAYRIKSNITRSDDTLELRNRDIETNYCADWEWKPHDFEDSEFSLRPEDFPALK